MTVFVRLRSRLAFAALAAACALLACVATAAERAAASAVFTEDEVRRILSHGPWPVPAKPDPTNRFSGKPEAIDFGARLFFEARLSAKGTVSCGSCHEPDRHWSDNLARGVGVAEVDRNTPTVMNLRGGRWYNWDGAADSLWSQAVRPLLDAREMAATPRHVAQLLRSDEQLSCRYRKAFGVPPPADDEAVLVAVAKAIAAFEETLVSGRTPFDVFREALARGDAPSSWTYSEPAIRGLKLFLGKGGCANCHSGPNFTNGEFFATGLSRFAPRGKPDAGRVEGAREVLASRFNLLGPYNDDASGAAAQATRTLAGEKIAPGEFKVPSLRNLVLSAPYGRDGSVETIAEVVRYYAGIDPVALHAKDGRPAVPLKLTSREQTDLVVFLQSLSTFANPWRPDDGGRCE